MQRIEVNGLVYEFKDDMALMSLLDENADRVYEGIVTEKAPPNDAPPNDPLTLEKLREMEIGVWVWIKNLKPSVPYVFPGEDGYMQKMKTPESTVRDGGVFFGWIENNSWHRLYWEDYGKTWLAYRRKPEEGTA